MKLKLVPTSAFKRDLKRAKKQRRDLDKLASVIDTLATEMQLPESYRDHQLSGNFIGKRECHIDPDWLLIYEIDKDAGILYLIRVGSHSDLF